MHSLNHVFFCVIFVNIQLLHDGTKIWILSLTLLYRFNTKSVNDIDIFTSEDMESMSAVTGYFPIKHLHLYNNREYGLCQCHEDE